MQAPLLTKPDTFPDDRGRITHSKRIIRVRQKDRFDSCRVGGGIVRLSKSRQQCGCRGLGEVGCWDGNEDDPSSDPEVKVEPICWIMNKRESLRSGGRGNRAHLVHREKRRRKEGEDREGGGKNKKKKESQKKESQKKESQKKERKKEMRGKEVQRLTPIRGRNQHTISLVTDAEEQAVQATARSRRRNHMFGIDRNSWMEITIHEASQSFQQS